MPDSIRRKPVNSVLPTILAALLFPFLFVFRHLGSLDFWWLMSIDLAVLVSLLFILDPEYWMALRSDLKTSPGKKFVLGGISAGLLYLLFFIGNVLSRKILGPAAEGIAAIYAFKSSASVLRIGLLMGILIGPGEELFWRGGLQRMWQHRFGRTSGFVMAAAFYAAVHLSSGNVMLVAAAAVCGLYWGWLYRRYGSALLNIVSHTLWDLAVFLLWPFG